MDDDESGISTNLGLIIQCFSVLNNYFMFETVVKCLFSAMKAKDQGRGITGQK